MNNFIHATGNLEKTVAFYRDVFGLAQPAPPRPPNAAVPALIDAPGAQLQVQIFRIPGAPFGLELTNFGPVAGKAGQAQPFDPGAAMLRVCVRDLNPVLAALKKAGATIVSRSADPARPVLFRDPDGYMVAVEAACSGAGGNVLDAEMAIVVGDLPASLKFYRDLLGFDLSGNLDFIRDRDVDDITGGRGDVTFRAVSGVVPGTKARIGLVEFHGVPRTPFHPRIPDPGCPAIALRVTDLDGLLARLKAAGVKVVSAGGVPAQFSATIRNIFVEDPDGFKIELYQSSQP
jgi:catechol 2,3-dioxygenase-like lactoylglutathione lyase family enzyme